MSENGKEQTLSVWTDPVSKVCIPVQVFQEYAAEYMAFVRKPDPATTIASIRNKYAKRVPDLKDGMELAASYARYIHPASTPINGEPRKSHRKGKGVHSFPNNYAAWIKKYSWVPSDECLVYFLGMQEATIRRAREALIEQGYEFVQKAWGYDVRFVELPEERMIKELLERVDQLTAVIKQKRTKK